MLSVQKFARLSASIARTGSLNRSFVSSSVKAMSAAKHDAHAHGHGHGDEHEHEHHDHPMWDKIPFNKRNVALMVFGGSFAGVALIVFACTFQQKKAGKM